MLCTQTESHQSPDCSMGHQDHQARKRLNKKYPSNPRCRTELILGKDVLDQKLLMRHFYRNKLIIFSVQLPPLTIAKCKRIQYRKEQ